MKELFSELSKVIGYKINTQKSLGFLYNNNKISGREIKERIPFTTERKRIKYLRINLPKETKTCMQTSPTLMKEIKDSTNRWRDIACSWIGRISTVTMTILPKAICSFNAIPINFPDIFNRTRTTNKIYNLYGNIKYLE